MEYYQQLRLISRTFGCEEFNRWSTDDSSNYRYDEEDDLFFDDDDEFISQDDDMFAQQVAPADIIPSSLFKLARAVKEHLDYPVSVPAVPVPEEISSGSEVREQAPVPETLSLSSEVEEFCDEYYIRHSDKVLTFFFELCRTRQCRDILRRFSIKICDEQIIEAIAQIIKVKPLLVGIELNPGPNPTVRAKRRGNYKKKAVKKNKEKNETTMVVRPPRPIQSVQKNSEMVELTYQSASTIFNNPGGSVISEVFNTNSVYDLLPTILTPTLQFVNYKFSLYKFAKVASIRFVVTFDNIEQFPIDVYFFSSAQSLTGLFATRSAVSNLAATRKLIWTDTISEQYGKKSQIIMDKTIYPWMAWGNKREYFSTNDFSATQSANPPKLTYGAWVLSSPFSTVSTGVAVRLSLNIKVLFYDALDIVTVLDPAPPISSTLNKSTTNIVRRA